MKKIDKKKMFRLRRNTAAAAAVGVTAVIGSSLYPLFSDELVLESPDAASSLPLPARAASRVWGGWLDRAYCFIAGYGRGALHFNTGGWGDVDAAVKAVEWMRGTEEPASLIGSHRVEWLTEWRECEGVPGVRYRDGKFLTPLARSAADGGLGIPFARRLLNEESLHCHFRYVIPPACAVASDDGEEKEDGGGKEEATLSLRKEPVPVALLLACSGDQGFKWRHAHFAEPLARDHGVASVVVENAFYGARRSVKAKVRGAHINAAVDIVSR